MPVCKIDSQVCKADLEKDNTKNFVLYLPALIVSAITVSELSFLAAGVCVCVRVCVCVCWLPTPRENNYSV
jgi:hypothetical protein